MRKLFFSLLLLLTTLVALGADDISFEASSPRIVAVGEVFRVEFALNASPDGFTPPEFNDFVVVAGPTTSQGQSISIVNGNMTRTVNFTYTYILQAPQEGIYNIAAAQVEVDGSRYSSNTMAIEVVSDGGSSAASSSSSSQGTASRGAASAQSQNRSATSIAADDILVRVNASKTDVYKGEPINVTVTLYTRIPIRGIESPKYPSFNGFWTRDLDVDRYQWNSTTLNGKVYDSRVIREYLVFPQQSGTLQIDEFSMTVVAQIVNQAARSNSMFDNFFGGGATVQEVRKGVSSPAISINVKEFPAGAPDSFSGAVGSFTLESDLSATDLSANASATYTLNIKGTGNLPLIQAPKLDLSASMEQYNIKTTESLQTRSSGISGYRSFEYPFIPRSEGSYTIPEVRFSYFDPENVRYVTLATPAYDVTILADSSRRGASSGGGVISGISREELRILDRDIRFIELGNPRLVAQNGFWVVSWYYYLALFIIAAMAVGGYSYLKRTLAQRSNIAFVKNKKANRVALQRLKTAAKAMNESNERMFYEEMLKAMWGYMGDKLNIPVANLTKDNIRESLSRRGISAENIGRFIDIISECEYAQYSPSASGKMNEIYDSAAAMLSKFESLIKK